MAAVTVRSGGQQRYPRVNLDQCGRTVWSAVGRGAGRTSCHQAHHAHHFSAARGVGADGRRDDKRQKPREIAGFLTVVGATGFEPVKAEPADLQSAPFGHLGTRPGCSPPCRRGRDCGIGRLKNQPALPYAFRRRTRHQRAKRNATRKSAAFALRLVNAISFGTFASSVLGVQANCESCWPDASRNVA